MNDALSFKDVIKKSLFKGDVFGSVGFPDIILGLIISLVLSLYIFHIYKKTHSGVIYNHSYNVSLVIMSVTTSLIIMTISSNLVLSLGMVGALSIVRFRTAVKEPIDTTFMFWAVASGLTAGARLYTVAITGTLFIGIVIVILMKYKNTNNIFMLIIHYEDEASDNIFMSLNELDYNIKSKTINRGITELTLEVKIIGSDTSFVEEISQIEGVKNTSLISYNGNFVGQ